MNAAMKCKLVNFYAVHIFNHLCTFVRSHGTNAERQRLQLIPVLSFHGKF